MIKPMDGDCHGGGTATVGDGGTAGATKTGIIERTGVDDGGSEI